MSMKSKHWFTALFFTLVVMFFVFAALGWPGNVSAAPSAEAVSNSCFTCHEDQYYLYDSGSSYCLTAYKDRCANCHDGDAATMKKEEAHVGLILHPQENNGARCQECHTRQVAQEGLAKFEVNHGFAATVKANKYTPANEVAFGFPKVAQPNLFVANWRWLAVFTALGGIWVALILISPTKP